MSAKYNFCYNMRINGYLNVTHLKVTDINAPIKYVLGFDLTDKKFMIKSTNDQKS